MKHLVENVSTTKFFYKNCISLSKKVIHYTLRGYPQLVMNNYEIVEYCFEPIILTNFSIDFNEDTDVTQSRIFTYFI